MIEIERNPYNQEFTTLQMPEIDEIRAFLDSEHDLVANNQIRYLIEYEGMSAGFIDLYDASINKRKAFLAIIIKEDFRRKQIASKAIDLIIDFARQYKINELIADVKKDNLASINFFRKNRFEHLTENEEFIRMVIRI